MVAINPYKNAQKVVIKIGSALLVDPKTGSLRKAWLESLCSDIQNLRDKTISVILVSSGAIAMGKSRLNQWDKSLSLSEKQACAAAGQAVLTQAYEDALSPHGLMTAQILLTLNDTEDRRRWLNARATLSALLNMGVIPIINENDTVATDEIRYGDNDRLAARAAQMVGADTLILLSDIDGLYSEDPRSQIKARHIPKVESIDAEILAMAGAENKSAGLGSGGMKTKLAAAQIATQAGCDMCIMNGHGEFPLSRLLDKEKSTWFKAVRNPRDARRQWIGGHLNAKGRITVDTGAHTALKNGKSLLAVGVTKVSGTFQKGDTVLVIDADDKEIARGIISYNAKDTDLILGKNTGDIAQILGYDYGLPVIHRDNLVLSE